jgi:hypothetical protein
MSIKPIRLSQALEMNLDENNSTILVSFDLKDDTVGIG